MGAYQSINNCFGGEGGLIQINPAPKYMAPVGGYPITPPVDVPENLFPYTNNDKMAQLLLNKDGVMCFRKNNVGLAIPTNKAYIKFLGEHQVDAQFIVNGSIIAHSVPEEKIKVRKFVCRSDDGIKGLMWTVHAHAIPFKHGLRQ